MNRTSLTGRVGSRAIGGAFLSMVMAAGIAFADNSTPIAAPAALNAIDFNFVGQANLCAPFQIDSGRLAEAKSGNAAIHHYAQLMVSTHIPVADALTAILKRKDVTPSNSLLDGAYKAMISTLKADEGAAFDRDYVAGQVEYQKANAALFREEIERGGDAELRQFAIQTLPKIEDHLQRARRLADASNSRGASN